MKQTNQDRDSSPGTGWQLLGKLEVPTGSAVESALPVWLAEILTPFIPDTDFLAKVLQSAQETVARAVPVGAPAGFKIIHLLLYIPSDHASPIASWGFFRIEKYEPVAPRTGTTDYTIEFYLYPEGH